MSDTLEFPDVEDIFEKIGTDPMKAREAAREVLIQIGNDPERLANSKYMERAKKGRASRALGHRLSNKVIEYYEELGYMAFRVDYTITKYGGAMQSMDMLGIGDVFAIREGQAILIQSTTEEKRTDHERKLCEDSKLLPRINKTVYQCACEWLEKGGQIELMTFVKEPRTGWGPKRFRITREWLDERKAKLDARRQK